MVLAIAVMAAAVGKPSTNLGDRRRISPHLHYRNTRCVERALPFLQRGDLPLVLRDQAAPDREERLGLGKIVPHALDRAGQQPFEAHGVRIDDRAEVSHGGFRRMSLVARARRQLRCVEPPGPEPRGARLTQLLVACCFCLYSAILSLSSRYSRQERKQSLSSAAKCSSAFAKLPVIR